MKHAPINQMLYDVLTHLLFSLSRSRVVKLRVFRCLVTLMNSDGSCSAVIPTAALVSVNNDF